MVNQYPVHLSALVMGLMVKCPPPPFLQSCFALQLFGWALLVL